MKVFFRCLASDFMKTKGLPVRRAHAFIPACMAGVFLLYYAYAPWSGIGKIEAYFQVMGVGLPVLAGLFCESLSEQEASASFYQIMLSAPQRLPVFYSKLTLLVSGNAFSVLPAGLPAPDGKQCDFIHHSSIPGDSLS